MTELRRAVVVLFGLLGHGASGSRAAHRLVALGALGLSLATTVAPRASAAVPPATAQRARPSPEGARSPGAAAPLAPRISVLTFQPGDATFSKFGHNAIRVESPLRRGPARDLVYNYGTFRFDSPFLILDFLTGRFRYWLSVSTMPHTLAVYRERNRTVIEQELALTSTEALKLDDFLRKNALPENRAYLYDYYRDNCSTRVRDAIDRAVGGSLREQLARRPGTLTFREHTLRLTAENLPLYAGLDVAMNDHIDQPISVWEEAFLPGVLREALRDARVMRDGSAVPLVTRESTLFRAEREPPPAVPPDWVAYFFAAGMGLAGVFVALAGAARRVPGAKIALAGLAGLLGLSAGILGLLFLGLWLGTNHDVAYHNENLLVCAPWALALAVFAPGLARGRPAATRRARLVAMSLAGAALVALLLEAFPFARQDNTRVLALLVPAWLGLAAALWTVSRTPRRG